MLYRTLFLCLFTPMLLQAQSKNSDWQIGVGGAVVFFNQSDVSFIGDKTLFQIPRLNLTMPINEKLSVDGALSFNTFNDIGFIKNSVSYFSADGSLRYNFNEVLQNFYPYVFAGGSLVDSERKMTPTLNIGAGGTYWLNDTIGLNTQLYYKHSFEGYESMRSHIQVTGSLVFAIGNTKKRGSFKGSKASRRGCYYDQIKY